MEGSSLKLTVEKGPREGETLYCRPGSVIRIGRVLKGNTFAIKDAGISSKHLLIEFKDGKWVVYDLETSNGTFLNKVQLQGMAAFDLRDEDIIKIGEYTSLKVNIEEESKPVKGSKKIGKKASVDVEIADEFDVENAERQLRRNPRRGATSMNTRASKDKPPKPPQGSVPKVQNISEKSSLGSENSGEQENVASVAENRTRRGALRKTKASKDEPLKPAQVSVSKAQNIDGKSSLGSVNCGEPENVATVAENRTGRGAPRRTKASKDEPAESILASVSENQNTGNRREPENMVPIEEKRSRRVVPKRTRSAKDESSTEVLKIGGSSNFGQDSCREPEHVDPVEEHVDPVEERQMPRMALRGTKTSHDHLSESDPIPVSEAPKIPERSKPQKEICNESNDNRTVDKNSVPTKVENGINLEKMTLGEWFDYLEVYLPKQIHEATEEIISNMRERAKQFNEFMSVQHDLKSKFSVA